MGEYTLNWNTWTPEENMKQESLFTLGNGYIGFRGDTEEGLLKSPSVRGTYINGLFEYEPIEYGEKLHGFPDTSQVILNIADPKIIQVEVDGERCTLDSGNITDISKQLDMENGILKRSFLWESPNGKRIRITSKRLVSFTDKGNAAIIYECRAENAPCTVIITSLINGDVKNLSEKDDPRVGSKFEGRILKVEAPQIENTNDSMKDNGTKQSPDKQSSDLCSIVQHTQTSGFSLSCAAAHRAYIIHAGSENGVKSTAEQTNAASFVKKPSKQKIVQKLAAGFRYTTELSKGEGIRVEKYIGFASDRNCSFHLSESSRVRRKAVDECLNAYEKGFNRIIEKQKTYLKNFWQNADICITGDKEMEISLRYNMFQLLQHAGRDGVTNIAAKGLSGEGYKGHYFWDTETYMLRFFLYTAPDIARSLLEFRYNTLKAARKRAKELSYERGALYPWRTIEGAECSPYYPAGTAQHHINADIAHAIKQYVEITGDTEFLVEMGTEILIETARLWMETGFFHSDGSYRINCVTGPDEYTILVNNNAYTNLMAAENLAYAAECLKLLKAKYQKKHSELANRLEITDREPLDWLKAANCMYVPFSKTLGIYAQDDSFLDKPKWNLKETPKEEFPLLLHYHPLIINRYQVCKQADLMLAEFLLSDTFSKNQKERDFLYYENITTHDSSLSACIFSILAAETGDIQKAYSYFLKVARTDIEDQKGNTGDGLHAANMAGAWMCLTMGFGGLRVTAKGLTLSPVIPRQWKAYSFTFMYRQSTIQVHVTPNSCSCTILKGPPVQLKIYGKLLHLKKGEETQIEP